MSGLLIKDNRLVALQVRTIAKPNGRHMSTSILHGGAPITSDVTTPYAAIGLPPSPVYAGPDSESTPRQNAMTLTDDVGAQLRAASLHLAGNAPLWLHVAQDSPLLAMFPWEREIRRLIGRPVVRVPNFLDDPFQPTRVPVVVACISAPIAKGTFSSEHRHLIESQLNILKFLASDAVSKTELHVFCDLERFDDLQSMVANHMTGGRIAAKVHRPDDSIHERTASGPRGNRGLANPWLAWISQTLRGKVIDIAHFICPGYYSAAHGALALAESPGRNADTDRSRFVGAEELAEFLNDHGTGAVGITAIGKSAWNLGLRLLGFELGWLRPGPLVVIDDVAVDASMSLQSAYEVLYGFGPGNAGALGTAFFSCHPRYFDTVSERSVADLDFGMSELAKGIFRPTAEAAKTSADTVFVPQMVPHAPLPGTTLPESSASLAERQIRHVEVGLGKLEANSQFRTWEKQGTADAVNFVKELLAKNKIAK
jgi:hypothetical protein